jgi:hypothetical protein
MKPRSSVRSCRYWSAASTKKVGVLPGHLWPSATGKPFLARIEEAFKTDPIDSTSEAVTSVFKLLNLRISKGEIEDVRMRLPSALRELWPEET